MRLNERPNFIVTSLCFIPIASTITNGVLNISTAVLRKDVQPIYRLGLGLLAGGALRHLHMKFHMAKKADKFMKDLYIISPIICSTAVVQLVNNVSKTLRGRSIAPWWVQSAAVLTVSAGLYIYDFKRREGIQNSKVLKTATLGLWVLGIGHLVLDGMRIVRSLSRS